MGALKGEIIFEKLVPRGRIFTSEDEVYFESIGLSNVNELLQCPLNELKAREFLKNFDPKKKESFVQGQRITISAQSFESLVGVTSGSDGQRGPRYLPPERVANCPPEWPPHFADRNDRNRDFYGWRVKNLKPKYQQKYEWFGRLILLKHTKNWTHLSNVAATVLVSGEEGQCEVDWGGFWFRNFLFEIKRIQTTKSEKPITTVIGQIICMILDATRQNEDDEVPCQLKRNSKLDTPTSITAGVSVQCHQEPRTSTEEPALGTAADELSTDRKRKKVKECKDTKITAAIDINKLIRIDPSDEQLQHIGAASIDYEQLDDHQQEKNVIEATNMRLNPASVGFVGGHEVQMMLSNWGLDYSAIFGSGEPSQYSSEPVLNDAGLFSERSPPVVSNFPGGASSLIIASEGDHEASATESRDASPLILSSASDNLSALESAPQGWTSQGSITQETNELEEVETMLSNWDHSEILGPWKLDPSQCSSEPVLNDAGLSSEWYPLVVSNGSGGASDMITACDGNHGASATETHDTLPLILPPAIDHRLELFYEGYDPTWILGKDMGPPVETWLKQPAENDSRRPKASAKKEQQPPPIELKVPFCCEECERKVFSRLIKLEGIDSVKINKNGHVTVTGKVKPDNCLKVAKKVVKRAEFWPKKKEEGKKDDPIATKKDNEPALQKIRTRNWLIRARNWLCRLLY